ncbi:MAG: PEGA domain-containing protein [Polyangiaceae bacterium]
MARGARFRRWCWLLALLLPLWLAAPARAQQPAPGAPPAADPDARREEARTRFQRGVTFFEASAWDAALAEFLRSRELFPTRSATKNAAVCLRKLKRHDEALDAYQSLLREFPDLPAEDRAAAEKAAEELAALVGTIELRGVRSGATVVVDGRTRGVTPLPGPLRVSAGTRAVRVHREGTSPFEARVDVAGGQTRVVEVQLLALTASGRLHVDEAEERRLEVLVDNVVVGTTPWTGTVGVGAHTVHLRGPDDVGTPPASARVGNDETARLTLLARRLESGLRIEPSPAGAQVALDGVPLGRGVWDGKLPSGPHQVEVAEEGFLPSSRSLTLAAGEHRVVEVALGRDPASPLWRDRYPPRVVVDLDAALLLTPSFGGDVAGGCGAGCSRSIGAGASATLHAGYQFPLGLGLGVHAGWMVAAQSTTDRAESLRPIGLPAHVGRANDALRLTGPLIGADAWMHLGRRFPVLARLGAGLAWLSLRDGRTGTFTAPARELPDGSTRPETSYTLGGGLDPRPAALVEEHGTAWAAVSPELRAGYRIGDRVELSFGVRTTFLIALADPEWQNEASLRVPPPDGSDGRAIFGSAGSRQSLTGGVVFLVAPSLGLRYDFTP